MLFCYFPATQRSAGQVLSLSIFPGDCGLCFLWRALAKPHQYVTEWELAPFGSSWFGIYINIYVSTIYFSPLRHRDTEGKAQKYMSIEVKTWLTKVRTNFSLN